MKCLYFVYLKYTTAEHSNYSAISFPVFPEIPDTNGSNRDTFCGCIL